MKIINKILHGIVWCSFAIFCGLALIMASISLYLTPALPNIESLKNYQLQTPMRILSADGKLIAEYGEQRRTPLRYNQVPTQFVQALIAIEDKRFEDHFGIDPIRFTRVVLDVLITGNKQGAGGSTLTQQVARNYFLTQKKTFTRKFTEILLALKMERELSKEEIFELYINKHYLGYRSYGVQAAATVYYGKNINDLSLPQLAMIAGLHQAPAAANPISNPSRAIKRRNAVLSVMKELDFITSAEYQEAINTPIVAKFHGNNPEVNAYYFSEMVRKEMLDRYKNDAYNNGFVVHTTLNSELQFAANQSLRNTLIEYSKRHGYLGPEQNILEDETDSPSLQAQLSKLNKMPTHGDLVPALVTQSDENGLMVIPKGETTPILLPLHPQGENPGLAWAKQRISVDQLGSKITNANQIANTHDIVRLQRKQDTWVLAQIPKVQGAFVALSPLDGGILALTGGFDFLLSKYNRVTQAHRQPGSNFKPFVYSAALDKGFTLATIVNDSPIVRPKNQMGDIWRPKNSGDRYLGPIPLRQALYQSRNLPSLRILEKIGVPYARDYLSRFGFNSNELANDMTLILGSNVLSPLKIATAYSVFSNGGYLIEPYFISRIEDHNGNILYEANPAVVCHSCPNTQLNSTQTFDQDERPLNQVALQLNIEDEDKQPSIAEKRYAPQVLSSQTTFLIDSVLKDVVRRGTATAAYKALNRKDIAGKTGTTNDAIDAWFSGYTPDIVATAWVGFDDNTSLGRSEYGGKAALPAWIEFMKTALRDKPEQVREQPLGIIRTRINPKTGLLARPNDRSATFEYFRDETVPKDTDNQSLTIDFSSDSATQSQTAPANSLF